MADTRATPPLPAWFRKLLEIDSEWSARLNIAERKGFLRGAFTFLAHSGDSWFMAPAMGLIWLAGDDLWKWRMLVLWIAMCITAVTAVGIKRLIGRRRPTGEWGLVYRSTDPHSFPSGHTARLVMMAVFSLHVGPPALVAFFFLWAPLVALSRVAMGVHYISDVIGGAVLGLAFGIIYLLII
jgi:membrane-associated phospholipid phosphatase